MTGKKSEIYLSWESKRKAMQFVPGGLEVANTGSTIAKRNFDYKYWKVRGYNFASKPQTLHYDFATLKDYAGYIKEGADIFIGIEEFKLLVDEYDDDRTNYKYYFYLSKDQIHGFSELKKWLLKQVPGFIDKRLIKQEIKPYIKPVLSRLHDQQNKRSELDRNKQNDIFFATRYMEGWNQEFGWESGKSRLTKDQRKSIETNFKRLMDMLKFCEANHWRPYVVVMPFSPNLKKLMPENILRDCLWDPLSKIEDMGYPVINLYHDEEFADFHLYRDSLTFNETGKRIFNIKLQKGIEICMNTNKKEESNPRSYCLRNGLELPWISFGTGVIWKYTRNRRLFIKTTLRQILSSIKHGRMNRELYGNLYIDRILLDAYDAGFRFFDTGRIYAYSENHIGKIFSEYQDISVLTKCSAMDITRKNSPNHVKGNLEISLKNLRRDSVELYLLHWPEGDWINYYRQIIKEYKKGNIKAFGACNLQMKHLTEIEKAGLELPMMIQTEIHPLNIRAELQDYCRKHGIQLMAFAPAAHSNEKICNSEIMRKLIKKYHKSAVQICIRWHYQHHIIPIVSTFQRKHMDENLGIFDFALSEDEMEGIDALDEGLVLLDSHGIDDPNYIWNY